MFGSLLEAVTLTLTSLPLGRGISFITVPSTPVIGVARGKTMSWQTLRKTSLNDPSDRKSGKKTLHSRDGRDWGIPENTRMRR